MLCSMIVFMAPKAKIPSKGTPHNLIQMRAPLSYVQAFRAAAAKRGITVAEAGKEAIRLWLDHERAPIPPIHPTGGTSAQ